MCGKILSPMACSIILLDMLSIRLLSPTARKLYEVIYDDSYYLKKDGNIVYDKAVKDDDSDDKHPIPYRKHAWTSKMGKLHFINEDANYNSEEVEFATGQFEDEQTPGLNITFGNGADTTPWKIMLSQFAEGSGSRL